MYHTTRNEPLKTYTTSLYRNALRAFRASILSQKRHLTRMRPSSRFGFEQMGSRYEFTTRLLVAIDTNGSMGTNGLARYFRILSGHHLSEEGAREIVSWIDRNHQFI